MKQNYAKSIYDIHGEIMRPWNSLSTKSYTGTLAATTAQTIAVPDEANIVHIVVNSGSVFVDLTAAIVSIPATLTSNNLHLLDNQEANYMYLISTVDNLHLYNSAASATYLCVIFGRTRNQYEDVSTAGRPVGDFG